MVPPVAITGERTPAAFWLLAFLLVVYVAAASPQRDNVWTSDAWEHHRALRALVRDLRHPGNPTYALDMPSVRYSPYLIIQAVLVRMTGVDPYRMLTAAAVVNTVLLVLGVWCLLRVFKEQRSAAAVLVAVVGLYWVAPGYANSLALADLPPMQVNPSAWSFALAIWSWAIFKWSIERGGLAFWVYPLLTVLLAISILDHGMTGLFAVLGIGGIAATRPAPERWGLILGAVLMGGAAIGMGVLWPWFSLIDAIRWKGDRDYWFNAAILRQALAVWPVPAYVGGLAALTLFRRELVRFCLAGGLLSILLGMAAYLAKSPVLARLPIAGAFLFAVAAGVFLARSEGFSPRDWFARWRAVRAAGEVASGTSLLLAVLLLLSLCLVPQLFSIFREPWLLREYFARALHKENKQNHIKGSLDRLLAGVADDDVVLADLVTSWPIPSSAGKIVAALHYELFVPDQSTRVADVERFFSIEGRAGRDAIIRNYHVRWILLNPQVLDRGVFEQLMDPKAVVKRERDLVLLDADIWTRDRAAQTR